MLKNSLRLKAIVFSAVPSLDAPAQSSSRHPKRDALHSVSSAQNRPEGQLSSSCPSIHPSIAWVDYTSIRASTLLWPMDHKGILKGLKPLAFDSHDGRARVGDSHAFVDASCREFLERIRQLQRSLLNTCSTIACARAEARYSRSTLIPYPFALEATHSNCSAVPLKTLGEMSAKEIQLMSGMVSPAAYQDCMDVCIRSARDTAQPLWSMASACRRSL